MRTLSIALLLAASVANADTAELANKYVASLRCSDAVTKLLDEWGAQEAETWPVDPTLPGQLPSAITMPGGYIGRWIQLAKHPDGSIVAELRSSRAAIEARWAPGTCVAAMKVIGRELNEKQMNERFTDDDLRKLVAGGAKGILYAWSPEMPHSVTGLPSIRKAAARLGLPVTVLLDPRAAERTAEATLRTYAPEEPKSSLRKIESTELLNRNFTMHFPTVMVYSDNRVVNRIFPGLASDRAYAQFVEASLK